MGPAMALAAYGGAAAIPKGLGLVNQSFISLLFGKVFEFFKNAFGLSYSNSIGLTIIAFSFCVKLIEFPFFHRAQISEIKWR